MISQTFEQVKQSFLEACDCFKKHHKFLLTTLIAVTLLMLVAWSQTVAGVIGFITLFVLLLLSGFIYHPSSPMRASYKFKDFYEYASSRALPLIGMILLVSIAVVIGVFLLIIPGIYIALALALSAASLLLSDMPVVDAMKHSYELMNGRKIAYLICYVIPSMLLGMVPFAIMSAVYAVVGPNALLEVLELFANNVIVVIVTMTQFAYYRKLNKK